MMYIHVYRQNTHTRQIILKLSIFKFCHCIKGHYNCSLCKKKNVLAKDKEEMGISWDGVGATFPWTMAAGVLCRIVGGLGVLSRIVGGLAESGSQVNLTLTMQEAHKDPCVPGHETRAPQPGISHAVLSPYRGQHTGPSWGKLVGRPLSHASIISSSFVPAFLFLFTCFSLLLHPHVLFSSFQL